MSTPSWFLPQRGPYGDVTGPLTGRMIVEEPQPVTVVVPGAGFDTAVVLPGAVVDVPVALDPVPVDPPTVPDMSWAASWVPACSTVCWTCARAAAGMLAPPIDAPFAVWPS